MRPRFYLVALGLGVAAALGCAPSPPMTSTTTPQSAQQERPAPPPPSRIEMADPLFDIDIAGITLDPQQRARVEAIRASLRSTTSPVRDAQRQLLMDLAEILDSGGTRGNVDAHLAKVAQAAQQSKTAIATALDDLHAVLTPEQRARVRGTFSLGVPITSPRANPGGGLSALPVLAESLGLGTEQLQAAQSRLRTMREEPLVPTREDHARHRAIMTAFHGPTFDASALGAGEGYARAARLSAQRTAQIVAALAPELNPPQRARLSEVLRANAKPPAR